MSYTFTSPIKNTGNNEEFLDIHFKDKVNELFKELKTILMVGWRHDSDKTFVDYLISQNKDVTIVEIYEPNLKSITQPTIKVICDDIRNYTPDKNYDLFLWQHEKHISYWSFDDYINLGFKSTLYAGINHDAFIFGYKVNH